MLYKLRVEIMKFSLYVSIPIIATCIYAQPQMLREIIEHVSKKQREANI